MDQTNRTYTYELRSRPFSVHTVPAGFIPDSWEAHGQFGRIKYPQPLRLEEQRQWGLVPILYKARFTVDGGKPVEGYSDGTTWNGWENVKLTREAIEEYFNGTPSTLEWVGKALILTHEDSDPEQFNPEYYFTEDGTKELYDFNGYCFDEVEEHGFYALFDRAATPSGNRIANQSNQIGPCHEPFYVANGELRNDEWDCRLAEIETDGRWMYENVLYERVIFWHQ